jgi:hypothetical protein
MAAPSGGPERQSMVEIVTFRDDRHRPAWETFIAESYRNPNYVLLSPAFLRWQFRDNPANASGGYTLWLVTHRERIVAQLGYVPFTGLSPAAERFHGVYPINLIVLPEYRAAGLGAILLKRLLGEFAYVLNPGSSQAGATLCMGLGMRDLGLLRRFIAVLDVEAASTLALDGKLPTWGQSAASAGGPANDGVLPVVARLPAGAPDRFSFPVPAYGAERSRAFFRWRYEQHPAIKYEFLLSEDRQGVLVLREERESNTGIPVVRIVDLLADGVSSAALLRAAVREASARGAAIVDFFCSVPAYDDALKRAGFFEESDNGDGRIAALFQPLDFRKLGIRTLATSPAGASAAPATWFVTKADSDQDRPNDRRAVGGSGK